MKDMRNNLRGINNQFYFPEGDCEGMSKVSEGVDQAKNRAFSENVENKSSEHLKKIQK